MRTAVAAVVLSVSGLVLAGCSFEASVGGSSVGQADLEQQITDQLTETVGQAPDSVSCPGDLDAEVDATIECSLEAEGSTYPVMVTVTEVDEETESVLFDIEVGDATTS